MSDIPSTPPAPPAGWFADPANPALLRWWSGVAWTEHVADPRVAPTAASTPSTVGTAAVAVAAPAAAPVGAVADAEPYVPFARDFSAERRESQVRRFKGSPQTFPIWLLAVSSLWTGAAYAAVKLLAWNAPLGVAPLAAGLTTIVLLFCLAWVDGDRLLARGYNSTSPAWILVLPIYFILRTVRVGWRGLFPLVTYLLVEAAVITAFVITVLPSMLALLPAEYGGPVPAPTPTSTRHVLTKAERAHELTPKGMAATFVSDIKEAAPSSKVRVVCEPLPNKRDGTITSCQMTEAGKTITVWMVVTDEYPTTAFTTTAPPRK